MILFKEILAKAEKLIKRTPAKGRDIIFHVFISLMLIISLMPIIAWYAGLFGILYILFHWWQRHDNKTTAHIKLSLKDILKFRHGRKALYLILFGVIIHGSCRIHSQVLLNRLYNEATHEKNIIIKNVEKNEN